MRAECVDGEALIDLIYRAEGEPEREGDDDYALVVALLGLVDEVGNHVEPDEEDV